MADLENAVETESAPEPTLREQLESAYEEHSEPEPAAEPKETAPAPQERADNQGDRPQRDETGRFKPKATPPEGRQRQKGAAELSEKGGERTLRAAPDGEAPKPAKDTAPANWRPEIREKYWGKLDPELKEEFRRLDGEVGKVFRESKTARDFAETYMRTIEPYRGIIQAEGGNVVSGLQRYLQAAQLMRTAPEQTKAEHVVNMMETFGVSPRTLDAALRSRWNNEGSGAWVRNGQPMPNGQPNGQQQQFRDPRLDQLLADRERDANQHREQLAYQAQGEVEEFKSQFEFADDVRNDMASILEAAARPTPELPNGRMMTLEQAYTAACQMNPEITRILHQREAASRARPQSMARARAAASSIRSSPALAPRPEVGTGSLRDTLYAAWDNLSER